MSGDLDTIEQARASIHYAIGMATTAPDRAWGDKLIDKLEDASAALARVRAALALRDEFIDRIGKRVNFETFQLSDDGIAFVRQALSQEGTQDAP